MTTVPDLAEPVTGWRVWQVRDVPGGPEIVSPVRPVSWPARRTMSAECALGCPTVPAPACRCGLYALADPVGLPPQTGGRFRVVGCTALWGRVVEHVDGFRAEHGYPLVLFVRADVRATMRRYLRRRYDLPGGPDSLDDRCTPAGLLARDLAARYGVPVGVIADQPALVGSFEGRAALLAAGEGRADAVAGGAARAVGREAVRGLAQRRAGDRGAHERLAVAAQDLCGGGEWYAPAA